MVRSQPPLYIKQRPTLPDRPTKINRPLIGYLRLDVRFRSGQAGVEVPGGVALTSAARGGLAWLSHGVRLAGHRDEEWLKRGLTSSR
jgi:hypothetical protein